MERLYFDNSATTALCEQALAKMQKAMETYGNPSSLHEAGREAEALVREARDEVALALGVRHPAPGEVVFTSCGSEANNLALFGVAHAKRRRPFTKILTTEGEHSSVEQALCALEQEGFTVVRIPTRNGVLDFDVLAREADATVLLATFMMVNNETGALYDVARANRLVKQGNPEAVTHCDAVQGFLKTHFTPRTIGADLVTVSGHKIHGPKGTGALYVSPDVLRAKKIVPQLLGGGQEAGLRSGTENVIGIAGFGAAAKVGLAELDARIARMQAIRQFILTHLPEGVRANVPAGTAAPHILNVTLPAIKSETMLHFLSRQGICVSSGSACSSHGKGVSRALTAFGIDAFEADCSLRISVCETNTEAECEALCAALAEGVASLVRIRR